MKYDRVEECYPKNDKSLSFLPTIFKKHRTSGVYS